MLVTTNPQRTLWEALLPPGYEGLPPRLARVDALLDDPVFVEPYRAHFSAALGRPSIPIETYLRMMFLKHTYRLGYESLCREVADSLTWLRFCRIPLGTPVPHPSTLGKLTKRCGAAIVTELNEALLAKASEAKVVKTGQVRADTTVVAANVTYPPIRACWSTRSRCSSGWSPGFTRSARRAGPRCGTAGSSPGNGPAASPRI